MSNLSYDRKTANGNAYSQKEAQDVIEQWQEIAKSLVDKDLRNIQRDLTSKVNNRLPIPDEFLGSSEIAYKVASVVTRELMVRKRGVDALRVEQMRLDMISNNKRLAAVYGK